MIVAVPRPEGRRGPGFRAVACGEDERPSGDAGSIRLPARLPTLVSAGFRNSSGGGGTNELESQPCVELKPIRAKRTHPARRLHPPHETDVFNG